MAESGVGQLDSVTTAGPQGHATESRVGLLGDFLGGFENTFKSQANGAIQLANKLGTNINESTTARVDNGAFGTKEWAAQLAGQAAALSVEVAVTNRLGGVFSKLASKDATLAAAKQAQSIAPEIAPRIAPRIAANVGLGAVLGGVLTPTSTGENFWSDRLRNSVSGAITFGAMGAVSSGLESSFKTGTGALAATLRNGYVNNAIGGFAGGVTGEFSKGVLSGQSPDLTTNYVQHLLEAGTEYSLVGLGSQALGDTARGVSSLGEQRAGTDRTNAKYLTDSIGLTKDPKTFDSQAEFKIISGKPAFEQLHSDLTAGSEQAQANVVVKQRLHGVLGDLFGASFRPYGAANSMLLSHGAEITPAQLAKSDIVATCSPLDGNASLKDVFPSRMSSVGEDKNVWLSKSANDSFKLKRSNDGEEQSVALGPVRKGRVEVGGEPIQPGTSLDLNDHLKILRKPDGELQVQGKPNSDGIFQKAPRGENFQVFPSDNIYAGDKLLPPDRIKTMNGFLKKGDESTDLGGNIFGKDKSGQLYMRDEGRGLFVGVDPGEWVTVDETAPFIHMGSHGKVLLNIERTRAVDSGKLISVNGEPLRSGSSLTVGRSADRDILYPNSDLSICHDHATITRNASGAIHYTDTSILGSWLKVPRNFKIPVNVGDRVGILNKHGEFRTYEVPDVQGAGLRPIQTGGSLGLNEPVLVGRSKAGTLFIHDWSSNNGTFLKLPKNASVELLPTDKLLLGKGVTPLNFEPFGPRVAPIAKVVPQPAPIAKVAQPVAPIAKVATPVAPIAPIVPPLAVQARPANPHANIGRTSPQANPNAFNPYEVSLATNIRYGYKEPLDLSDPADQKFAEKQLAAPVHKQGWDKVMKNADVITVDNTETPVLDDIGEAKGLASYVAKIIRRKTLDVNTWTSDKVGYSAIPDGYGQYIPMINWDGFEGQIELHPKSKMPVAIFNDYGREEIPQ